jgi:hypothetical protein
MISSTLHYFLAENYEHNVNVVGDSCWKHRWVWFVSWQEISKYRTLSKKFKQITQLDVTYIWSVVWFEPQWGTEHFSIRSLRDKVPRLQEQHLNIQIMVIANYFCGEEMPNFIRGTLMKFFQIFVTFDDRKIT